jgi:hypothetical protein
VHSHRYRITIEGDLGRVGCAAFEEFNILSNDGHTSLVTDLDRRSDVTTLCAIFACT